MTISPDTTYPGNIKQLFDRLGLFKNAVLHNNRVDAFMAFSKRETAFTSFATGFWPIDPYGDAEILFSENLNPLAWTVKDDKVIHDIVAKFSIAENLNKRSESALKLNEHIFDEAVFNIYSHSSYSLTSSDPRILERYQESVSDPMPWQIVGD
ncbi:MAG TPA: hypothetical protein VE944_24560 [Nostoc sp.]|uniref:hypothetical protein n=1 Tax=Nostoc sp. TaxID=1180 RepID=UPI002D6D3C02|nr:hypothetical protein [Nostoc sp.]HYX17469.1 hypothetical protein [Nostoc sp.]